MQILRRDVFEIDLVDLRGGLHIKRHPRRRGDIVQRKGRILAQRVRIAAAAGKLPPGGGPPRSIDGSHALHDLKQPCAPRNAIGLESGGHGKADGLFRPALVRDDKMRSQRIQSARHAFDRSIKGFQINGKIAGFCHTASPPLDMDMIPPKCGRGQEKIENMFDKKKGRKQRPASGHAGRWAYQDSETGQYGSKPKPCSALTVALASSGMDSTYRLSVSPGTSAVTVKIRLSGV